MCRFGGCCHRRVGALCSLEEVRQLNLRRRSTERTRQNRKVDAPLPTAFERPLAKIMMNRCFSTPAYPSAETVTCLNDRGIPLGLVDISGDREVAYMHIDDGMAAASRLHVSEKVGDGCAQSSCDGGYVVKDMKKLSESIQDKFVGFEHSNRPAHFLPPGDKLVRVH